MDDYFLFLFLSCFEFYSLFFLRNLFKFLCKNGGMDCSSNVFVEKKISEIDVSSDVKVRILGTVVSKVDDSIFVDDGTGTVQVAVSHDMALNVSESQLVRVFGRLRLSGDGFDLYGEIIQNMSELNMKQYNQVMEYYNVMD